VLNTATKLKVLRDKWIGCTKCGLCKLRQSPDIVFGSGPYDADFLLLTDAPGEYDVECGTLLMGEEGQLVEDMLSKSNINPSKIFRVSVVGCRPYVVVPETENSPERIQDRSPRKEEIDACWTRVQEIIYLVDPRIIIAMGDEAFRALVHVKSRSRHKSTSTAVGDLFDAWVPGRLRAVRYPVIATLSPRQLVANPSAAAHGPIATTLDAFMKASKYVSTIKKEET